MEKAMQRFEKRIWPFAAMVFLLLAGCEGGESLMPVRGKVSYQGTPLRSGIVVFSADAERGTDGPVACAAIDFDGTYSLKTGDKEGIAPGWYRVTVTAVADNRSELPIELIPEKYRDPQLSSLQCQVKRGHDNVVDFDLQ
jgi:hypothetical protein